MISEDKEEGFYRLDDMSKQPKTETFATLLAFGVFGFVIYASFSVFLSAAQDALRETLIPTAVIIIIFFLCVILMALILPHFIDKMRQSVLLVFMVSLMIVGMIVYILMDLVLVRIAGVFLLALGLAMAEVNNVSMSALYDDKAMAWFSFGTGLGIFIGPIYFTGMTTLICVSSKTTIMIVSALPLAYLLMYAFMEKRDYSQVLEESFDEPVECSEHLLSCSEKLALMKENGRNVATFGFGAFVEYVILSSIVTTLVFQNSPFNPRDHYVYYVSSLTAGDFIGRSYVSVFSACNSQWSFTVQKTWIFAVFMFIMGILLGFAAWYRFLPSVYVVLVLVFAVGVCVGMLYINTILSAADDQDFQSKVFSRGFSLMGMGAGALLGCLFGMIVEPVLRQHCLEVTSSDDFCFTRSMHGWNSTASCLSH